MTHHRNRRRQTPHRVNDAVLVEEKPQAVPEADNLLFAAVDDKYLGEIIEAGKTLDGGTAEYDA